MALTTEEVRVAVTRAIVGLRRPDRVVPIQPAAIVELTDVEVAELEASAR
jgi:hypothetical protein